ncbi:hypothetical protein [Aeromonas media]|uniref:hypothetical protein n=1 Tax=Aeromonas media TaxID=651 RepID=UPI003D04456B
MAEKLSERLKPKKDAEASFFIACHRLLLATKAFNVQSLGSCRPSGAKEHRACLQQRL